MTGLKPLTRDEYIRLIKTSRAEESADLYLRGGTVINVYTGELLCANVAVSGRYIAYVGSSEKMIGDKTTVIDVDGKFLCPGYIEPHAHPFLCYNPVTLARKVLTLGTTAMVCDNLFFFRTLGQERLTELINQLSELPVKLFWSARLDPQTQSPEAQAEFAPNRIGRLLEMDTVRQVGELTDWPSLLQGKEDMVENMLTARAKGKKVEGHAPGASPETLNALAAAGVTACHEAINSGEALQRLRMGMYATLRHSSLRPDLPEIIKGLLEQGISLHRAMLTTDGPSPYYLADGYNDFVLKVAMNSGVEPITAYRMATLNAAAYHGLDHLLGGIAPGRLADILILQELSEPTPEIVIAQGSQGAGEGRLTVDIPEPDWSKYKYGPLHRPRREVSPDDFLVAATGRPFPVMQLVNPVITRRKDMVITDKHGFLNVEDIPGLLYAALLDPEGHWITCGLVAGFAEELEGFACSTAISGGVLALGRNPEQMALAVRRLYELGGGFVLAEGGHYIYELSLVINGVMSPEPMEVLIRETGELRRLLTERGHKFYDPIYTLLFMSATHLPELRLTPEGLVSVKDKTVLSKAKNLY